MLPSRLFFPSGIHDIRKNELHGIRVIQNSRSAKCVPAAPLPLPANAIYSTAFAYSIPVLAATLALVTYTRTTEGFNVAVIFASLSLFQVIPMIGHF